MSESKPYWMTLVELKNFTKDANDVFSSSEKDALFELLAISPEAGDEVAGLDNIRIIQWPTERLGKDRYVSVYYFFRDLNIPVFLLTVLEKGERLKLTPDEKRRICDQAYEIAASYGASEVVYLAIRDGAA